MEKRCFYKCTSSLSVHKLTTLTHLRFGQTIVPQELIIAMDRICPITDYQYLLDTVLPKYCGDVVQVVEHRIATPPTQVRFPGAARDFSQCRLSYGVRTPPCAVACTYICTHVKNPVVHGRVRWIMETLKHLTCTIGWVVRLCRSWLSPGKATRISHGI